MSLASYFVILKQITTQETSVGLQDILETSSKQDPLKICTVQIGTAKCDLNK